MEPNEQQTGAIQVMPTTVLGNGQQIILQSLQQQLNANGQQQIQVVPILQGAQGGSYILQPQQSQPQIVQLPDGQTFIYHQPVMAETQQSQPQIVNINGNFFQIPAQQTINTAQLQNQANAAASSPQQTQQVVMIPSQSSEAQIQQATTNVNSFTSNSTASPPPQPSTSSTPTPTPVESEEEPLYVNASEFKQEIWVEFLNYIFELSFQNNTREFWFDGMLEPNSKRKEKSRSNVQNISTKVVTVMLWTGYEEKAAGLETNPTRKIPNSLTNSCSISSFIPTN